MLAVEIPGVGWTANEPGLVHVGVRSSLTSLMLGERLSSIQERICVPVPADEGGILYRP